MLPSSDDQLHYPNISSDEKALIYAKFLLSNQTGRPMLVDLDWAALGAQDDRGNRYVEWSGDKPTSFWVASGESKPFERYLSRAPKTKSRVPGGSTGVTLTLGRVASLGDARWKLALNEPARPFGPPAVDGPRRVGEAWDQGGLDLTLAKLDVRAQGDYDDAALQASFTVTNRTGQPQLFILNFGSIVAQDDQGQIFLDWEGGGTIGEWIEPNGKLEFQRYLSVQPRTRGRVRAGAPFVVLSVPTDGAFPGGRWKFDIAR